MVESLAHEFAGGEQDARRIRWQGIEVMEAKKGARVELISYFLFDSHSSYPGRLRLGHTPPHSRIPNFFSGNAFNK